MKIAVTIAEAAEMSGIGRSSLYKLIRAGEIRPRKRGRQTLIIVTELEGFVRALPVVETKNA